MYIGPGRSLDYYHMIIYTITVMEPYARIP